MSNSSSNSAFQVHSIKSVQVVTERKIVNLSLPFEVMSVLYASLADLDFEQLEELCDQHDVPCSITVSDLDKLKKLFYRTISDEQLLA